MTARTLRPRAPIAIAPLAVSTENVLAVGGITPRKLRELLVQHKDIPRSRVGHTLIVTSEDFYRLLERLRIETDGAAVTNDNRGDDDQPTSVDDVLARAGKERVRT